MTAAKRKAVKPKRGDVFAVPLLDGTFGLGHVIEVDQWQGAFALFPRRETSPAEFLVGLDASLGSPLSILVLTANALKTGAWPIIANRQHDYGTLAIPTDGKGASHTFGVATDLLNAYHGLVPWDGMADPDRYRKLLIPGIPLPRTIRYKRDFTASATADPLHRPRIDEGPAIVTIQIVYPATGMPSTDLLRKRQAMERRLEAEGAGEVEGAESGAGVMEVYLRTEDVRRAVPLVEKIGAEMGFADDMLLETSPIEDEDDEAT